MKIANGELDSCQIKQIDQSILEYFYKTRMCETQVIKMLLIKDYQGINLVYQNIINNNIILQQFNSILIIGYVISYKYRAQDILVQNKQRVLLTPSYTWTCNFKYVTHLYVTANSFGPSMYCFLMYYLSTHNTSKLIEGLYHS